MGLKILIDMNMSPAWINFFKSNKIESVHWSNVGNINEEDSEILNYTKENGYILFTNDLDFGALLAAGKLNLPSVIQIRAQDVLPGNIGDLVIASLRQYETLLKTGALISIDEAKQRARILPIK